MLIFFLFMGTKHQTLIFNQTHTISPSTSNNPLPDSYHISMTIHTTPRVEILPKYYWGGGDFQKAKFERGVRKRWGWVPADGSIATKSPSHTRHRVHLSCGQLWPIVCTPPLASFEQDGGLPPPTPTPQGGQQTIFFAPLTIS